MRFALSSESDWVLPDTPGTTAFCFGCGEVVYAKAVRSIYIANHWAHYSGSECSMVVPKENEGQWHREWKSAAPKKNQEVTVRKESVRMRADVKSETNTVFEMQHSEIGEVQISAREEHYGRNQVWICDGKAGKVQATAVQGTLKKWNAMRIYDVRFEYMPAFMSQTSRPTFIDNGDKVVRLLKGSRSERAGAVVGLILPTEIVRHGITESCSQGNPQIANFFFDSQADADAAKKRKKERERKSVAGDYSSTMVCPSVGDLYEQMPSWIQNEIINTAEHPRTDFRLDRRHVLDSAPRTGPAGVIAMAAIAAKGQAIELSTFIDRGQFPSVFMAERAVQDAIELGYVTGQRTGRDTFTLQVVHKVMSKSTADLL